VLDHFTDLDDVLAVGSYPQTPEDIEFLRSHGISAVVSLQSDADLRSRGIQWSIIWQLYTRARVAVARVPVTDFDRRDLGANLDRAVAEVHDFVEAGRKVYIHCNAGMNRSPSTVIAYLVAHRSMSLNQAITWLTDKHSCVPYPDVLQSWDARR